MSQERRIFGNVSLHWIGGLFVTFRFLYLHSTTDNVNVVISSACQHFDSTETSHFADDR